MRRGKPKDKRNLCSGWNWKIGILLANGLHSDFSIAGKRDRSWNCPFRCSEQVRKALLVVWEAHQMRLTAYKSSTASLLIIV